MHTTEVQSQLIELAVEVFEVEANELVVDVELVADLGATSVSLLEYAVAVERKFGLKLEHENFTKAKQFNDLVSLILERLGNVSNPKPAK